MAAEKAAQLIANCDDVRCTGKVHCLGQSRLFKCTTAVLCGVLWGPHIPPSALKIWSAAEYTNGLRSVLN